MEFDEAETSAEAAVVRAAVANRYLTAEQLREALLLREEFARSGQRVGLLQLLRQRHLPPHALPELSAIYHQVLSGLGAQPATYDPVPSGLAPKAIARARLLLQQHPAMDPPRVKVFVNRVGLALGYADSDSGRLPHAGEGSGPLVAKRPDSGRLAPDSARLSRDSGRLAPDSGRLIPHTAEVPAHGAPAARHVDSDSGRLIPHTAEVPAQPIAPEVDHNAATVAAAAVQRFGRYLVESELARGGMGVVYKAKDPHLERYVALKVMQGDGFELDPTDEVRFVREAKATAKMRHPNIVSVLDTGTDHGFPYLVMDLVQGESLGERIKRSGPLDPPEAARLAAAVARALDYSHQQGVLHRDVKPSNILLEAAQGTPLLTDFGLARNAQEDGSQLTGVGQAVGTPSYMAPEQATGERELLGPATDVYGLGATLYHMLAGHPPFRGGTISVMHAVVAESPKPLRELRESVPRELDAICMRCLAKDPASRFQSAGELAAALEAVAKAAESSDPERARATRPAPRPRGAEHAARPARGRWALLGVSVCGVALLGASFVARWRAERATLASSTPTQPSPPASRVELARRYLSSMTEDPELGPRWQREHRLEPLAAGDALPWQVAEGLEAAPNLPAQRVLIAVALGLQDRFEEADRLLGETSEALALRAELRAQARRHSEALALLEHAGDARAVRRERIQLYASQQDLTRALAEARALPVGDPLRAAIEGEARVRSLPDPEQRLRELEALLAAPASPAQAFRLRFDVAQVLLELRRYAELEDELERMHALRPDSPLIPFLRYLRYNTERNYPEVTRALDEGLAYERDPEQAAMLGWLRVQSLWLSGDKVRSRAAREALLREGPPAAGVIPLAAQISAVVQQPADALAFAEAGRANPALSPEGRWTCLRVSIEVLRASGAWAELRTLIEGLEGEPLPPDLFQTLAEAHAEATRALEGR